jgi:predicted membrane protein
LKSFRGLLSVVLVVAAIYVMWQVIPPYFHNYQFQDSIDETARFSGIDSHITEEDIRQKVLKLAQEYEIPLTAEQINVTRNGSEITISADYIVHVNLPVKPVDLDFHPTTKQKPIM